MKYFRTVILVLLAVAGLVAFSPADAKEKKPALTKEERLQARQLKITQKATASTELKVKEGKHPNYNRLLKSTNYKVMYTEGLRYYHMKRKRKDENSRLNYQRAQNLFQTIVESQAFAGTPRQDSLAYYFGSSFYKSGDFNVSEQVFDRFRRDFPTSKFIEDAEYMYAMGFYFSSPGPEHDQTVTLRAISAITEYEGRYPDTTKKKECEERIMELRRKLYTKSFENAKLYYTIGQYKAAVRALNNSIDEFPESPYREELMYLATRSAYLFARNSISSLQTDRYMSMMDNYYNLISEYPETQHLREIERMRDEARQHIEKHTKEEVTVTEAATENGN